MYAVDTASVGRPRAQHAPPRLGGRAECSAPRAV